MEHVLDPILLVPALVQIYAQVILIAVRKEHAPAWHVIKAENVHPIQLPNALVQAGAQVILNANQQLLQTAHGVHHIPPMLKPVIYFLKIVLKNLLRLLMNKLKILAEAPAEAEHLALLLIHVLV